MEMIVVAHKEMKSNPRELYIEMYMKKLNYSELVHAMMPISFQNFERE